MGYVLAVVLVVLVMAKLAFEHNISSRKKWLAGAELKLQRAIIILEMKQQKIERIKTESNQNKIFNRKASVTMLDLSMDTDDSEIEKEIKKQVKEVVIGAYGILSEKTEGYLQE